MLTAQSGQPRLTLTVHIEQVWGAAGIAWITSLPHLDMPLPPPSPLQVTGLAVSPRHPYMFSCGLDKMVKCWDLEQNKV